jgi:uncharacterized repeat protein (TIGR03987 family)
MFSASVIIINLALVFYTIGVWAERIARVLKWWHVVFFGLGLTADSVGTFLMIRIATDHQAAGLDSNVYQDLMAWTGSLAIGLMALHLAWAIFVLIRNRRPEVVSFHKFSVMVWAIWLVPYLAGAVAGMAG